MKHLLQAIIISVSSDIGAALARRWLAQGWRVCGTYRNESPVVAQLRSAGATLVHCDLSSVPGIDQACEGLREQGLSWDAVVFCPGSQEPVGQFESCDFDEWTESVQVNFTGQMRLLHHLLPSRGDARAGLQPLVLFFAGGGTNSATLNYSAYTLSKIAAVKMCELLDAEIPDARFAIVGPGWVNTKIHQQTVSAGARAGANYQCTVDKIESGNFFPLESVLDCCDWIRGASRDVIGGRNISAVHDEWGSPELDSVLVSDGNMYKLRRFGNEWGSQSA